MIFNRLRNAEWTRVDRVSVREMMMMAPAVAHFINRLVEFAHTGPEFVSGKRHATSEAPVAPNHFTHP